MGFSCSSRRVGRVKKQNKTQTTGCLPPGASVSKCVCCFRSAAGGPGRGSSRPLPGPQGQSGSGLRAPVSAGGPVSAAGIVPLGGCVVRRGLGVSPVAEGPGLARCHRGQEARESCGGSRAGLQGTAVAGEKHPRGWIPVWCGGRWRVSQGCQQLLRPPVQPSR